MGVFDSNLLCQVQGLNQKQAISQESFNLKRKIMAEERGKHRHHMRKDVQVNRKKELGLSLDEMEGSTIDITI